MKPGIQRVLQLAAACTLAASIAGGQTAQQDQGQTETLADAIVQVRTGNGAGVDSIIGKLGPVKSVPVLEDLFAHSEYIGIKERIASVLYRLGDKDPAYWNFMLAQAKEAAESKSPSPYAYDAQGKMQQTYSPEFIAWAKAWGVAPENAEAAAWEDYRSMLLVAAAGDRRALPVLRQALKSPNYPIASVAAKGLAQLQDGSSISLIIKACQKAPADAAALIANALVYFDDARAQAAADQFLPAATAKTLRAYAREHGDKPFSQAH